MLRLVYQQHQSGPNIKLQLQYQPSAQLQPCDDLIAIAYAQNRSLLNFLYVTHETMCVVPHLRGDITTTTGCGGSGQVDSLQSLDIEFADKDVSFCCISSSYHNFCCISSSHHSFCCISSSHHSFSYFLSPNYYPYYFYCRGVVYFSTKTRRFPS